MQDEETEIGILKMIRITSIWILLKIKRNGMNAICQRNGTEKFPRPEVPFKIENMEVKKRYIPGKVHEILKFWKKGTQKAFWGGGWEMWWE